MFTRILFCLTFLAANLLSDYLDESDEIKLLSPDDREQESSDPRYTFVFNSFSDWIQNTGLVSDNGINYYLAFPTYANKYIGLNDTAIAFPLIYTVTGAALVAYVSAYLVSQIPLPEFGLGRSDPELGFGLQRDLSEYSNEYYDDIEDTFSYEYPDSFFGSASEKKEKKVKLKKGRRKLNRRSGQFDEGKQFSGIGFFERIASTLSGLFSPVRRSSDTLKGGFQQRLKMYEEYWKNRRRSSNRRLSKQGRSQDLEPLDSEDRIIGPQIPRSRGQAFEAPDGGGGGGHRFYTDRVQEAYRSLYT